MDKDIKEDIVDAVEEYSSDDDVLAYYYDKEHNDEAIRRGDISLAEQRGLKKGIQQRNIEIARNLLKEDIDINIISKTTGLTVDEIGELSGE